jgi:hypothetical protein
MNNSHSIAFDNSPATTDFEDHTVFALLGQFISIILNQSVEQHHQNKNPIEITFLKNSSITKNPELFAYLLDLTILHYKNFKIFSADVFVVFYFFIIFFGIVSNFSIVYAFYKDKTLRTYRNVFIINLTISDILLCSICAPLTLQRYLSINWRYGRALCRLGPFFQQTNTLVSVFSIVTIAIDRWIFILNTGKDNTKKIFLYGSLILIWTLAVVLCLPVYLVTDQINVRLKGMNENLIQLCEERWPLNFDHNMKHMYLILIILIQFVVPVMIVVATNLKICYFLIHMPTFYSSEIYKKSKTNLNANQAINENQQLETTESSSRKNLLSNNSENLAAVVKRHNKTRKFARSKRILLFVCGSFVFCWLPLLILNIYLDFFNMKYIVNEEHLGPIFLTFHLIAMLSSCINPILYGLLNKNFYQSLTAIFFAQVPCIKHKKRAESSFMSEKNLSVRNGNVISLGAGGKNVQHEMKPIRKASTAPNINRLDNNNNNFDRNAELICLNSQSSA